jgi:hypothetical protein
MNPTNEEFFCDIECEKNNHHPDCVLELTTKNNMRLVPFPKIIGYWILPGSTNTHSVKFTVYNKPNWFHCKMMQLVLGWKWECY